MAKKELDAAWGILRFTLRDVAFEFSAANKSRVGALPREAPPPERILPIVKSILGEIDAFTADEQKSPVLRAIKRTFSPSDAEKAQKKLTKTYEAYFKAWEKREA